MEAGFEYMCSLDGYKLLGNVDRRFGLIAQNLS